MTDNVTRLKLAKTAPKPLTMDCLPGYWRGRAKSSRLFADQERQHGNMRAADELDRQALEYEAKADALERSPGDTSERSSPVAILPTS